jgi:hypothetical protein
MRYFKNRRHQILVTIDDEGKRTIFNDGISFVAPEWYQPAYEPIEEIDEDEYRYIAASGDWEQPAPPRNDSTMYLDWD